MTKGLYLPDLSTHTASRRVPIPINCSPVNYVGAGKTVTMVEAIKQVVKLKPGAHIVAAAPSNAAADLLAQRLIGKQPHYALFHPGTNEPDSRTICAMAARPMEHLPHGQLAPDCRNAKYPYLI
jgi:hypothetical protein